MGNSRGYLYIIHICRSSPCWHSLEGRIGSSSLGAFSSVNFTLYSGRAFVDGSCYSPDRQIIFKAFLYGNAVIKCQMCFRFVHITLPFPARTDPILHIFIVLHICLSLNATASKSVAFKLGKLHLLLNFTYH